MPIDVVHKITVDPTEILVFGVAFIFTVQTGSKCHRIPSEIKTTTKNKSLQLKRKPMMCTLYVSSVFYLCSIVFGSCVTNRDSLGKRYNHMHLDMHTHIHALSY